METKKIMLLASDCESSKWLYNSIKKNYNIKMAIIEPPISKKVLFKKRIKRIGMLKVIGQTLFSLLIVPILKYKAKNRKTELLKEYDLSSLDFEASKTKRVDSVNDDACKEVIEKFRPDIILVNGTRIISKKILNCTNAIFVNMHVGITPWYRGSHGGYWAIYNNDIANFGTTIHLVDSGIDTGAVIEQSFTKPGTEDNFTTYPIIQAAEGINLLKKNLPKIISGNFSRKKHQEKGVLYYQPTIWQYLINSTK
jgi:methionyl-tRNA formyltransferase